MKDTKSQSSSEAKVLARLAELERLTVRLDSRFQVPFTRIRVGYDPLVGLVPIAGDLVMAALGLRIIAEATRLGAKPYLVLRMAGNTLLDFLVGSVPFAGPVFDALFRSNERNLRLLLEHVAEAGLIDGRADPGSSERDDQ